MNETVISENELLRDFRSPHRRIPLSPEQQQRNNLDDHFREAGIDLAKNGTNSIQDMQQIVDTAITCISEKNDLRSAEMVIGSYAFAKAPRVIFGLVPKDPVPLNIGREDRQKIDELARTIRENMRRMAGLAEGPLSPPK